MGDGGSTHVLAVAMEGAGKMFVGRLAGAMDSPHGTFPGFYRDSNDAFTEMVRGVDMRCVVSGEASRRVCPAFVNLYRLAYWGFGYRSSESYNSDIYSAFFNAQTLHAIKFPLVQEANGLRRLDPRYRISKDGIGFGPGIVLWFAWLLRWPLPYVQTTASWYERGIVQHDECLPATTSEMYGFTFEITLNKVLDKTGVTAFFCGRLSACHKPFVRVLLHVSKSSGSVRRLFSEAA